MEETLEFQYQLTKTSIKVFDQQKERYAKEYSFVYSLWSNATMKVQ